LLWRVFPWAMQFALMAKLSLQDLTGQIKGFSRVCDLT
jgi:hypothetical protein